VLRVKATTGASVMLGVVLLAALVAACGGDEPAASASGPSASATSAVRNDAELRQRLTPLQIPLVRRTL